MRSFLSLSVVMVALAVTPAGAEACPQESKCLSQQRLTNVEVPRHEAPRARRIRLALSSDVARRPSSLATTPTRSKPATDEPEMPWIWQQVRTQFYRHMPTYEREQAVTMTLGPVVVAGQFDTVPGVGLAGKF